MTRAIAATALPKFVNIAKAGLLISAAAAMFSSAFSSVAFAEEAAKAESKPDIAKGSSIAQAVCAACHLADGNATGSGFPKLAGQHEAYLYKQLSNFKTKPGAKVPERANGVMMGMATSLSDADMHNVAAYYASQKQKPSAAKNKDLVELGQKIYRGGIAEKSVPACAGCHSPNGAGIPAQFPRLSGQWAEYTEAQLVAFRAGADAPASAPTPAGARTNNAPMMTIASRLSDREIKAVADYVAGLR